jgi:hypothetical protein
MYACIRKYVCTRMHVCVRVCVVCEIESGCFGLYNEILKKLYIG